LSIKLLISIYFSDKVNFITCSKTSFQAGLGGIEHLSMGTTGLEQLTLLGGSEGFEHLSVFVGGTRLEDLFIKPCKGDYCSLRIDLLCSYLSL